MGFAKTLFTTAAPSAIGGYCIFSATGIGSDFSAGVFEGYGSIPNTVAREFTAPGTFTLQCKVSDSTGNPHADSVITAIQVGNLTSS